MIGCNLEMVEIEHGQSLTESLGGSGTKVYEGILTNSHVHTRSCPSSEPS